MFVASPILQECEIAALMTERYAQNASRTSAIMTSSLRVSLPGLVTVSLGSADLPLIFPLRGSFQEVPSSTARSNLDLNFGTTNRVAEKVLRVYFRTACFAHLSLFTTSMLNWRGSVHWEWGW